MDYASEGVLQTLGVAAIPNLEASEDVRKEPTAGECLSDSAASGHVSSTVRHRIVEERLQIGGEVAIGAVGNV